MVPDDSWEALCNPGKATEFFAIPRASQFDADATAYSSVNAWWLAELSRLIYKQGADEVPGFQGKTRREILAEAQLEEVAFIPQPHAQCAIVKPLDEAAPPFVVLVFRGSHNWLDWRTNFDSRAVEWKSFPGRVHEGFRDALAEVVEKLDSVLESLPGPAFYTGHSLGAALATLAAAHRPPRAVYAFGSPRVGNAEFHASLRPTKVYRVVNSRDIVATAPPPELGFGHCGELRYITREGEILVDPTDDHIDRHRPFQLSWHPELLLRAPEELADHAPINYVNRLRALV